MEGAVQRRRHEAVGDPVVQEAALQGGGPAEGIVGHGDDGRTNRKRDIHQDQACGKRKRGEQRDPVVLMDNGLSLPGDGRLAERHGAALDHYAPGRSGGTRGVDDVGRGVFVQWLKSALSLYSHRLGHAFVVNSNPAPAIPFHIAHGFRVLIPSGNHKRGPGAQHANARDDGVDGIPDPDHDHISRPDVPSMQPGVYSGRKNQELPHS